MYHSKFTEIYINLICICLNKNTYITIYIIYSQLVAYAGHKTRCYHPHLVTLDAQALEVRQDAQAHLKGAPIAPPGSP